MKPFLNKSFHVFQFEQYSDSFGNIKKVDFCLRGGRKIQQVIRKYEYFPMISVINLVGLLLNRKEGGGFCCSLQQDPNIVGNGMKLWYILVRSCNVRDIYLCSICSRKCLEAFVVFLVLQLCSCCSQPCLVFTCGCLSLLS